MIRYFVECVRADWTGFFPDGQPAIVPANEHVSRSSGQPVAKAQRSKQGGQFLSVDVPEEAIDRRYVTVVAWLPGATPDDFATAIVLSPGGAVEEAPCYWLRWEEVTDG